MHILLVEDDKSIIMGLAYSLESEGYTVTAAESQVQALEALEAGTYDLLLLDVMLADGSGYDTEHGGMYERCRQRGKRRYRRRKQ